MSMLHHRTSRLALIACAAAVLAALPFISNTFTSTPVQASATHGAAAGAVLFHEKGCEHCHGVNGIGTDRGPDLTIVGKRLRKSEIEQQIEHGGKGMPAFATLLQPDEVKDLVAFLHKKKKAPKRLPNTPPPPPVDTHTAGSDPGL